MKKDNVLYELIYDYYESRILFGYYRYGEQLLSVPQICTFFRMGRNTVLAALEKLEENGYIVTEERKVARIAYQADEAVFRENTARYFVPRREGILDFPCAGKLLFVPMWEAGLRNLKQGTGPALRSVSDVKSDAIPIPVNLYIDALRTFHNNLLLELYWQCLHYLNFLYPKRKVDKADEVVEKLSLQNTEDGLRQGFDYYYIHSQNRLLDFIAASEKEYHLEHTAQIPFRWRIYRRRPQVRYTLASRIIREILWEIYPVGSYLPSLPKMAEQYRVSVSTVRRTLAVLQSLGVTRTYMGIGTQVCLEPVDFDVLHATELRENLRLHGEGMQILALTVRGVTLYTLESAAEEKRERLLQEITNLHGKNSSILCIDVLLNFISGECPSAIIRECYGGLRELIAWGYILSAVLMGTGQLKADFTDITRQMEADLRAGDFTSFAGQWQSFVESRMDFFNSIFPFEDREQDSGSSLP